MIQDQKRSPLLSVDWVVIAIYVTLLVCGWFSICGATHELGDTNFFDWGARTGKQLVWIGCAFVMGFVILMTDDKYYDTLAGLFYWSMMAVLLVTPFIAHDIKGSKSWINIGICNVQPAEFAKCATALAVAKLCDQYNFSLNDMHNFAKAAGLILLPMVLIVLQRETGSALVYLAFLTSSLAARSMRVSWIASTVQSEMASRAGMAASSIALETSALVLDFLLVKNSTS